VLEDWFDDAPTETRQACGLPDSLVDKTKPEIALALLQAAVRRGPVPFRWVAAAAL
jgi:SRSO17 transposase